MSKPARDIDDKVRAASPARSELPMSRHHSTELHRKPRLAVQTLTHSPAIGSDAAKVRVLIISEIRLYREALALRLGENECLAILEAVGPDEALAQVRRLEPDVVLLDAGEWHGLDLAETLLAHRPELRIVALAVSELAGYAISATWRGIAGFVPRNGSIDDVICVLERLIGERAPVGGPALAPQPGDLWLRRRTVARPAIADLTRRQGEILEMIELGLSNKEIARHLHIGLGTVKNHVHNILEKLNVRGRSQAAHCMRARSLAE
jgi:DNA-binding NarL/FixJ family response regulator